MGIKAIFASGTPGSTCFGKQAVRGLVTVSFNSCTHFLGIFSFTLIIADRVADFLCARAGGCIQLRLFVGYSSLDLSTLYPHRGHRDEWHTMINAVHVRGMYYVVDITVATMDDPPAWKG